MVGTKCSLEAEWFLGTTRVPHDCLLMHAEMPTVVVSKVLYYFSIGEEKDQVRRCGKAHEELE